MQPPPLLPPSHLSRVLAVARADGWMIIGVAGASLGWLLWQQNLTVAGFAAGAVLAGISELHGRRQLLQGVARGRHWLIAAQLSLLVLVWCYLGYSWNHFDPEALWSRLPGFYRQMVLARLTEQGLDPEFDRILLLQFSHRLTCIAVALVVFFYQGGLAFYYQRQARLASPEAGR
jgi:hypothetical protein